MVVNEINSNITDSIVHNIDLTLEKCQITQLRLTLEATIKNTNKTNEEIETGIRDHLDYIYIIYGNNMNNVKYDCKHIESLFNKKLISINTVTKEGLVNCDVFFGSLFDVALETLPGDAKIYLNRLQIIIGLKYNNNIKHFTLYYETLPLTVKNAMVYMLPVNEIHNFNTNSICLSDRPQYFYIKPTTKYIIIQHIDIYIENLVNDDSFIYELTTNTNNTVLPLNKVGPSNRNLTNLKSHSLYDLDGLNTHNTHSLYLKITRYNNRPLNPTMHNIIIRIAGIVFVNVKKLASYTKVESIKFDV